MLKKSLRRSSCSRFLIGFLAGAGGGTLGALLSAHFVELVLSGFWWRYEWSISWPTFRVISGLAREPPRRVGPGAGLGGAQLAHIGGLCAGSCTFSRSSTFDPPTFLSLMHFTFRYCTYLLEKIIDYY